MIIHIHILGLPLENIYLAGAGLFLSLIPINFQPPCIIAPNPSSSARKQYLKLI